MTADEINVFSVNNLPYLLACLDEALQIHPPVPDTLPRDTSPIAEVICGQVVPLRISISRPVTVQCSSHPRA